MKFILEENIIYGNKLFIKSVDNLSLLAQRALAVDMLICLNGGEGVQNFFQD